MPITRPGPLLGTVISQPMRTFGFLLDSWITVFSVNVLLGGCSKRSLPLEYKSSSSPLSRSDSSVSVLAVKMEKRK